jgi:hypothetical protein
MKNKQQRQQYLDCVLRVVLAAVALELQHNLLRCLGLKRSNVSVTRSKEISKVNNTKEPKIM